MHGAPSVEGEARPAAHAGGAGCGRCLRRSTAFMPKVRAPSRRGSARYWASTSPTAWPGTPVAGSTSGIEQRAQGLTSFSRTGPSARGEDDLVEMVLAVRVEAAEHEVGPKARHRHRRLAGAARGAGSPRRATALDATSSGKPSWNEVSASSAPVQLAVGQAPRLGIEARQAERPAEEVAEPLRAERAHVEGRDACRSRPSTLQALLDPVEGDVQGQHAGRAQDHLARSSASAGSAPCAAARAGSRSSPAASTTIQARSRSKPVSISSASRGVVPAHDLIG